MCCTKYYVISVDKNRQVAGLLAPVCIHVLYVRKDRMPCDTLNIPSEHGVNACQLCACSISFCCEHLFVV